MTLAPLSPKVQNHWITPEAQLRLLVKDEWRHIAVKIQHFTQLDRDTSKLVAEYAFESNLTHWYTSLQLIDKLPKKIPPLPKNFLTIFHSACPPEICDTRKPDGETSYTIGEKCTLALVPEELGTVDEFESVIKTFGEKHYSRDENPLQFRDFKDCLFYYNSTHKMHPGTGSTPFGPTHWVLLTNDVLEHSLENLRTNQIHLVSSLAKNTLVDWQIPTLCDTIAPIFLKKIATGESLYQGTFTLAINRSTYNWSLMIGGFFFSPTTTNGLQVFCNCRARNCSHPAFGIAAMQRFDGTPE